MPVTDLPTVTGELTEEQRRTIAYADHILTAPKEYLDREPQGCLIDEIDVAIRALSAIHRPGVGWRVIELEILQGQVEKRYDQNPG